MSNYFQKCESIQFANGAENIGTVLETIANRYIGSNPVQPFVFRVSPLNGFKRNAEYRYVLDFEDRFPEAENEQCVYAWAKMWSNEEYHETFLAVPYSPMEVYINGEPAYHSNFYEEKTQTAQNPVQADLIKGWNSIVIRFIKTTLGFGGEFGTSFFKGKPWHFLAPTSERDGQEGFIYTAPIQPLENLPRLCEAEQENPVNWYPEYRWNEEQEQIGQLNRIYGIRRGCFAYGWTKALLTGKGIRRYQISGENKGELSLYLNGAKIYEHSQPGQFQTEFEAKGGFSDLVTQCRCGEDDWGFRFSVTMDGQEVKLLSPCSLKGTQDPWIYAGPFEAAQDVSIFLKLNYIFQTVNGRDYWRADLPSRCVRVFLETTDFGNWNYPLGVTLYGLLKTGEILQRQDISGYVKRHVELCTKFYDYALWDKENFGASGVDAQIAAIDSLDDCGSFASTMLEVSQSEEPEGYRAIADRVADYISSKQARLPDGSLYRYLSALPEMKNTMWLDDLYMSVPFLSRYYRLTGDHRYLDDAVQQFRLYRQKMFLPKWNVMSHVYYTDREIATGIPWGRGNGWVLFSLSELLQILPEDHEHRQELLAIYRELCEGYLALQDDEGLWHQVLNDWESYQESSCSSMFLCGFARGVRFGWLPDTGNYTDAVIKGWNGLTRKAVARNGDIYGICKGSGHSFTPRYYKYELNWILNDTHGIGILLMAGVETMKLMDWLEK